MQNSTVTIKERKTIFDLSILFNNKKNPTLLQEDTIAYNCIEKVHVYQTIF